MKLKLFKQVSARQLGATMRWSRLSLFADKLCMSFHFTQLWMPVYLVNKRQQYASYSHAAVCSPGRRAFVKHLLVLVVFHLLWERAGGKTLASNKSFLLVGRVLSLSITLGTGPVCSHPWTRVMSLPRDWAVCHYLPHPTHGSWSWGFQNV